MTGRLTSCNKTEYTAKIHLFMAQQSLKISFALCTELIALRLVLLPYLQLGASFISVQNMLFQFDSDDNEYHQFAASV